MFVMTIDQRASRRRGDAVPELLGALAERTATWAADAAPVLPFERTVGDEVQGLLPDAGGTIDLALAVRRLGGWSVGIGAGPVDLPLGPSSRASSGGAFLSARDAVERARSRTAPVPVAVSGADAVSAREAEAVLQLLAAVVGRRTAAGWAAIDTLPGRTQRQVADALGITPQAVSQRLRTALWEEEQAVRPVAARLLTDAAGTSPDGVVVRPPPPGSAA